MGQGYKDHLVTQEANIPEAKGLYTNDIQRLYKVASSIVNVKQQDMDLSTYIGQIASLKEEFLTVMPFTTDVGINEHRLTSSSWFLRLLASVQILRPSAIRFLAIPPFHLDDVFARLLLVTEVEANVLIAPIAISLATLVIGVINYMGGLPALPTWPSHLILSRLNLPVPPPLRVFPSLTVSMMTISAIRPPSQLLLLLLPRLLMVPKLWLKVLVFAHPLSSLPLHSVLYAPETGVWGRRLAIGRESQGLYHLTSPSTPAVCISTDAPLLIHSRLGHPSLSKFHKMVPRFSSLSSLACESCQLGKHTRVSFPKRFE
ncbi:hypothetical protein CK203_081931 [Vitis vinifera]|uniref:GAG-pre-integrase domain-containing protein n=1 Tax=Vitis vinifera TaxID=29760 RepID=A0A438DX93_VITVI|nr:hypothetical protein CK203_081931 [Vitis vinifera]